MIDPEHRTVDREPRTLKLTSRPSAYWETPAMTPTPPKRLLPRDDMLLVRQLEDLAFSYQAIAKVAAKALGKMRDQLAGQPGAASYDGPGVHAQHSVMWCWKHGREVADCLKDDEPCRGESVVIADPTGEAAIRPDEVALQHHQLVVDVKAALTTAGSVQATIVNFATGRRAAPSERDDSTDSQGTKGCESCARLPSPGDRTIRRWEPPFTKTPTTVNGTLEEPKLLCRVCWDHVREFGKLPSKEELEYRHQHGRWRKHEKKRAS